MRKGGATPNMVLPLPCVCYALRVFIVSLYPRMEATSLVQKRGVSSSVVMVWMLVFS